MRRTLFAAASALLLISSANAQDRVEVGILDCQVSGGGGLIFGSTKHLTCTFDNISSGPRQNYKGQIKKFGIDIGSTKASEITWTVLAPRVDLEPGALSGKYIGATAEATVGRGAGANLLIGGFENSIAIQPVSVQTQKGLNFAIGIADLELEYVKP